MAADDYVDKLPDSTRNLRKRRALAMTEPISLRSSAARRTWCEDPGFLGEVCPAKLDRDFLGLYRFLNDPYPAGPNYYLDRITANMERLKEHSGGSQEVEVGGAAG